MIGQQPGVLHLRALNQFPIHHNVHVIVQLFFDGFYHLWVAVPHITNAYAANKIKVFFTVCII